MTLFQGVKANVTAREAAERYGLRVGRGGFARCPFHPDKTPSLKVDERFHCFGCGADGDVIDFAARLHGLALKAAAQKLAQDFAVSYEEEGGRRPRPAKPRPEQLYEQLEDRFVKVLTSYLLRLKEWEQHYAPAPEDESWHPLFQEALLQKEPVEFLLDTLSRKPLKERAALISQYRKEIETLERRLSDPGT